MEKEMEELKDQIQKYIKNKKPEWEINILEDELREMEIRYNNLIELHKMQACCDHVFIEDLIDLTPDKSMTIEYCVHCLFQK